MRLLVVEDDPGLARVLVRALTDEGHAVDHAGTVLDADHAVDVSDYDLAVVDLGLPDGDGVDLVRSWRAEGRQLAVLVLTARDGISDRVGGLDAGADDYLAKPFAYPELAARVRALLRRPSGGGDPVLSAGDLRLDPSAHTVHRSAILVPLTQREFALLEYLLRRRGEVCSREALIEHVWDVNYDGMSNVVDVHLANLRRKLALPGHDDLIETVRGVGYRIRGEVGGRE